MSLIDKLNKILGSAFTACGLPAELGAVRVSDRPDLAQFQCNGAMAAAKQAKNCLLYTSPSPRDRTRSRMPSSA